MYKIIFLIPSTGIKPFVVLNYLLSNNLIINHSLTVLTDNFNKNITTLKKKYNFKLLKTSKDLNSLEVNNKSILISCGWNYKINKNIINNKNLIPINCHGSFLPDYKGGSAYIHYWANCEKKSGVTIHFINENFDEGNIITQKEFKIKLNDSRKIILENQSIITAKLLPIAIKKINEGYKGIPQKNGRYFTKQKLRYMYFYRTINYISRILNIKFRLYTKHKWIKNNPQ